MDTSWPEFEREWTQRTVDSINWLRNWSGLTIKQLAGRLRALGWPVSDATMSGMLSGNKRTSLSVAEVFAFARALNVSPLYLVLGLPNGPLMPHGALWGELEPQVTEVGSWVVGRRSWEPFPGDDVSTGSQNEHAYVRMFAEQGLRDTLSHAELLGIARWQAAQLVVVSEFPAEQIEAVLPKAVLDQDYLWSAVGQLSGVRREQAKLGDDGGIEFPDLPEVLAFVDVDPVVERDDFSLEELRALATDDLMDRARNNIRWQIRENAANAPTPRRGDDRTSGGLD